MIFTENINKKIKNKYQKRKGILNYIYPIYDEKINKKDEGMKSFLMFYYAYMPVQDILDYPLYFFEKYAEDSLELYEEMGRKVLKGDLEDGLTDEQRDAMFLNYVAFHRSNNEDISHSRMFKFEGADKKRFEGLSDYDKVKEINYWASEHVSYAASDDRTMSAVMTWMNGVGRCGEESVFLIEVLRSNGIMARQVYVPFWSHCDDNHAWVEVFVGGDWHYLGACEPEATLDKAWFTNAAKRAIIARTMVFTDLIGESDEIIGNSGNASFINITNRYARTNEVEILVKNEFGEKVPDCEVHIQVVNYSSYKDVAVKHTDVEGKIKIKLGIGTVNIRLKKENIFANYLVNTEASEHELVLKENENNLLSDKNLFAPSDDYDLPSDSKKVSQDSKLKEKKKKSTKIREEKIFRKRSFALMKYESYLEKAKTNPDVMSEIRNYDLRGFFEKSYANIISLITFLDLDGQFYDIGLKLAILNTLREKDFRDFEFECLYEHLSHVKQYIGSIPDDVFIKGILPIRIADEYMSSYVKAIDKYMSSSTKERLRNNPTKIATYVDWLLVNTNKDIVFYPDLYTWAEPAIKYQIISQKDRELLIVAIARTIGVPAYLRAYDKAVMLYINDKFTPLFIEDEIKLKLDENTNYANFSISRIEGANDIALDLSDFDFDMPLKVKRGTYRLIISTRFPNGNIWAKERVFDSEDTKELSISRRVLNLSEIEIDYKIDNFKILDKNQNILSSADVLKEDFTLLFWIKSVEEPSVHIINELKEKSDLFRDSVVVTDSYNDLDRLKDILPNVYYQEDSETVFDIERKTYVNAETYPLVIIVDNMHRVKFAHSGYSVGVVDLALKIKERLEK